MMFTVSATKSELGARAATEGAEILRNALAEEGEATIFVATGMSQFEMLENLVNAPNIEWGRVTAFHLDEYVGLSVTHPASFRKYLRERFVAKLSQPLAAFHEVNGEGDPQTECDRLQALISGRRICLAFVGIGENGHLAFNDPPADFVTQEPYLVVNLDDACRRQQLGEGWFPTFEDVPAQAISMSIQQILKAERILCSVPDARKAEGGQKLYRWPRNESRPGFHFADPCGNRDLSRYGVGVKTEPAVSDAP